MTTSALQLTTLAAWQALKTHYSKVRELHLRNLFADDPKRGERLAVEAAVAHYEAMRQGEAYCSAAVDLASATEGAIARWNLDTTGGVNHD